MQDEIKEVDMEIEDDDETLPGLEKSLGAARTSNLIELTSSQDVDLRIRPNQSSSRIGSLANVADADERFPPRVPFPPSRADRSYLLACPNDTRVGVPPVSSTLSTTLQRLRNILDLATEEDISLRLSALRRRDKMRASAFVVAAVVAAVVAVAAIAAASAAAGRKQNVSKASEVLS